MGARSLALLGQPRQEGVDGAGVTGHRGLGERPARACPAAVEQPGGERVQLASGQLGGLGELGPAAEGEEHLAEQVGVDGEGLAGAPGRPLLVQVVGDPGLKRRGLGDQGQTV